MSKHLPNTRPPGRLPRIMIRPVVAVLVAALLAFVVPPSANAGTMVIYSCHTPSGRTVGTDGWSVRTDVAAVKSTIGNYCGTGALGSLFAGVRESDSRALWSEAGWVLDVVRPTRITGFSASVCAQANRQGTSVLARSQEWSELATLARDDGITPSIRTSGCNGVAPYWQTRSNEFSRSQLSLTEVSFVARCPTCAASSSLGASVEVSAFRADIRDGFAPAVTSVDGDVVTRKVHAGVERLVYDASDVGVGVFRAVALFRAHGEGPWVELSSAPATTAASCVPLRETEYLYEFTGPAPCPTSVHGSTMNVDNTALPSGVNELRVVLEDASGNQTDLVAPRLYEVSASPSTSLDPESSPAPLSRTARIRLDAPRAASVKSGRGFSLTGIVVDADSHPVGAGVVKVESRPYLPQSDDSTGEWSEVGNAVTNANGVFRLQVPAGASRTLRAIYVSTQDGTPSTTTSERDVVVPAQVKAHAQRARVRNGQAVDIRGRVAGPLPQGGVLVALEVLQDRKWIPVATTRRWVRTSSTGRFSLSYRFRRTFEPMTYRFRVVAGEDSSFQYSRGASSSVDVRVRP